MFFDDWSQIGRAALLTALVYLAVLAVLRAAGSRAIAKMSAHDLMVTVALGSLLATIPLQSSVSFAHGLIIIAAFLALQRALNWLHVRWPRAGEVIRGDPTLVLYEGRFLRDRMRASHVAVEDVRAAVRNAGLASLQQVHAVVLEIDGSWSVIQRGETGDGSALEGLDLPRDTSA